MFQNITGQKMDYNLFKSEFDNIDANPQLKNLVQSFNGQGVIIKTKEKNQPTEFGQEPKLDNNAAKQAAKNFLKK